MLAIGLTVPPKLRAALHKRLRRELPEAIYGLNMQGHRLLIAQDKAEEMARGLIHKPPRVVEQEQTEMGSGWVVAVGPMAGAPGAPHPVGVLADNAGDLLGVHVYYRMYAGNVFRTDDEDDEFGGKCSLVVLTDRDVQAVDEHITEEATQWASSTISPPQTTTVGSQPSPPNSGATLLPRTASPSVPSATAGRT